MKPVPHGEPYAGKLHVRFDEGAGVPDEGRSALLYTLPYMFYCICLTTRNGRGGLRGTLRLNARHFEADERG